MRVDFYFRLFFTFLFFSILITLINFYVDTKYRVEIRQNSDRELLFSQLENKTQIANISLKNIEYKLLHLDSVKKLSSVNQKDLKDKNIKSLKFYYYDKDMDKLKRKSYFIEISKHKLNNVVFYELEKNKTLYLLKRSKDGILEINYDLSFLFDVNKFVFGIFNVFDKDGNYLFDINSKDKIDLFNPTSNLQTLFPEYYKSILKYENYIQESLYSTKISIADKFSFIIVSISNLEDYDEKFINSFDEKTLFLIFIIVFISFVLSLIFSNPASALYKKILLKNTTLSKKNEENELVLNESLILIDAKVMIVKINNYDEIIEVSDALCKITKFSKNELIGHNVAKFIDNNFLETELRYIWDKVKKLEIKEFEVKGITKDGDIFWLKSSVEPIFSEFNEIQGFSHIFENITEHKKIEELYKNLEYQLKEYSEIFNHVNSGIAILDLKGNFLKFNEKFCELLNYSKDELHNTINFTDIINETKEVSSKILTQIVDIKTIPGIEKVFLSSTGRKIHLDMVISLLPDNNSVVLIVNSLKDKRKQQEINQLLEKKIQEELEKSRQKDELHKQEQIKNAKLTSIGSLAAGITHEINTPLTYIKGSFELMGYDIEDLPDGDIKTRMLEDKEKIHDGLNRIANIVESMREISQKSAETIEKTNIYSTLITVLTMAYNRSKQISPIYLKEDLFEIGELDKNKYEYFSKVQKQRIEQVWIIIINNALDELVKIEGYENRKIEINLFKEDDEIVIKFEDNAGGIPKDVLPNIFDPFMSTKEHSGMGIGLNVAKNIIDQQDGGIKAFNKKDGAVFEVRLKEFKE